MDPFTDEGSRRGAVGHPRGEGRRATGAELGGDVDLDEAFVFIERDASAPSTDGDKSGEKRNESLRNITNGSTGNFCENVHPTAGKSKCWGAMKFDLRESCFSDRT